MNITIDEKIEGKFPAVKMGKSKYGVTADIFAQLQIGRTYSVVIKSKQVPNKQEPGKFYNFTDIITVLGEVGAQSVPSAQSNGSKYSAEDRKAFEAKDHAIRRACALNNACTLTEAYINGLAAMKSMEGLNPDKVRSLIQSFKASEYAENFKILQGKPIESETDEGIVELDDLGGEFAE